MCAVLRALHVLCADVLLCCAGLPGSISFCRCRTKVQQDRSRLLLLLLLLLRALLLLVDTPLLL
jgi:hypothetical protein